MTGAGHKVAGPTVDWEPFHVALRTSTKHQEEEMNDYSRWLFVNDQSLRNLDLENGLYFEKDEKFFKAPIDDGVDLEAKALA